MISSSSTATAPEPELLAAARRGEEAAFQALIEPHRGELYAHCYRMLGSFHDAEDALQDALLRAWRGLAAFEGRSSLRSWLYRIATNVCLKAIARRPKRVLPIDYGPPADVHDGPGEPLFEALWLEPFPNERIAAEQGFASPDARYEQRESIELAFVAALQHLPPRQRAALILRDVLGFAPGEIAEALGTTSSSVYSILQRARKTAEERLPDQSQQATLRAIGDERLRHLVERYVQAWEEADVAAILAMLTDDATFTMPPRPTWYSGREAVGAFLARNPLSAGKRWRLQSTRANGQIAFAHYGWAPARGAFVAHAIQIVAFEESGRIGEITAILGAAALRPFGLPDELP
jgi:RNA polymerase sigma-70 factor, ECF subfamily